MLSSRAAAFSVEALLTCTQEREARQQQQHHHQQHPQQQQQHHHHHQQQHHHQPPAMVDACEPANCDTQGEASNEGWRKPSLPPTRTVANARRGDSLGHEAAAACEAQLSEMLGAAVADDGTGTNEEELLVDLENCSRTPPNKPGEGTEGVTLDSSFAVPPICHTNCRAPGEMCLHQFKEEIFTSASPTGATDWQVMCGSRCVGGCRGGGRAGVNIHLLQPDLWTRFHALSTEMIITKNGRRMFPVVKVKLRALDPEKNYMVFMDMVAVDTRRYRYVYPSSRWMVAGTGEPLGEHPPYIHPDSPATGVQWMAAPAVAFDRLKLTNNKTREAKGQIILHSMQKYLPRVWVQEVGAGACWTDLPRLVDLRHAHHAVFPETTFITVTAYQNQQITRLKIDSNPFAKGFRDTSKQKELERQPGPLGRCHDSVSMEPSTLMLPLGVPPPHHLHYVTSLAGFSPQFSLAGPVTPPVSPLLLPSQWLSGILEGSDRQQPWMHTSLPLLQSAPPALPFLIPPFLPAIHTHLPHALDLSKRKDDT